MRVRHLFVGAALASALVLGAGPAFGAPAPGSLDPGFGSGGIVTTPAGQSPSAAFADGVAAVGTWGNVAVGVATGSGGNGVFTLARYGPDGTLDQNFGSGGIVTTDFGLGGDNLAAAVAVTTKGDIVGVGYAADAGDADYSWAIAEYQPNGSLNRSFGTGGLVTENFGGLTYDFANAVTVEPSGKIAVAGTAGTHNGTQYLAIAVLNKNGALDSSFGTGGEVLSQIDWATTSDAYAVTDPGSGELFVAGDAGPSYTAAEPIVAAYSRKGVLEAGFGTGGVVSFTSLAGTGSFFDAIATNGDQLAAAGEDTASNGGDFLAAEMSTSGSPVDSFGSGGMTTVHFSAGVGTAYAAAFENAQLVLAGDANGASDQVALARLNLDGSLDSSFGTGGEVVTQAGQAGSAAYAMVVEGTGSQAPNPKLVVAGIADNTDGSTDFMLARYLG